MTGRQGGAVRQEGSEYEGEITGEENARLSQGNRVDGTVKEEDDKMNEESGTAA